VPWDMMDMWMEWDEIQIGMMCIAILAILVVICKNSSIHIFWGFNHFDTTEYVALNLRSNASKKAQVGCIILNDVDTIRLWFVPFILGGWFWNIPLCQKDGPKGWCLIRGWLHTKSDRTIGFR